MVEKTSEESAAAAQEIIVATPARSTALTPMEMLSRAVENGQSIDVLDKLMGLQERYEANLGRKAFDEAMFILLCGTGVGFSVERQYVNRLPEVPERIYSSDTCIKQ